MAQREHRARTAAVVVSTLAAGAAVAVLGVLAVVYGGLYDVGAVRQHTQAVHTLLETTMRHSVRRRAAGIEPPPLADPVRIARGAACYREHCAQCHGGHGVAPQPVGLGMQPLPGPLVDAARRWHAREIYWITRHGIRMSGMPAWQLRLTDAELWAVTAFVAQLPTMAPPQYAQAMAAVPAGACPLRTAQRGDTAPSQAPLPPRVDASTAQLALRQYACVACHRIPGVTGSPTDVGPPLAGLARRSLIAGRLPNTPQNLVRWLQDPQGIKPGTAMPDLDVGDDDARVIAAYLAQLH